MLCARTIAHQQFSIQSKPRNPVTHALLGLRSRGLDLPPQFLVGLIDHNPSHRRTPSSIITRSWGLRLPSRRRACFAGIVLMLCTTNAPSRRNPAGITTSNLEPRSEVECDTTVSNT